MRADNRTRNENNAVCQPRNPACHSRTFAILGVFHEHSSTRKLNLKWNSAFAALIPDRPRLCRLWNTGNVCGCSPHGPRKELQQPGIHVPDWARRPRGLCLPDWSHFPSQFCQICGPGVPKAAVISVFQNPFTRMFHFPHFLHQTSDKCPLRPPPPQYVNSFYFFFWTILNTIDSRWAPPAAVPSSLSTSFSFFQ